MAEIVGVATSVLRYWETEFSMVKPGKTRSRHRLYRRRDVETLLEIKRLLHAERYTIDGAKKRLKVVGRPAASDQREQMVLPLGERTYREMLDEADIACREAVSAPSASGEPTSTSFSRSTFPAASVRMRGEARRSRPRSPRRGPGRRRRAAPCGRCARRDRT